MTEPSLQPIRYGVAVVIPRGETLLVIRRSALVLAPGKFCFPGGGIEPGESEAETVIREISEELGVAVTPVRRLWQSSTRWRVDLAWWLAELSPAIEPVPNPAEVESCHWLTIDEMLAHPELLDSNRDFLTALLAREFSL